MTPEMGVPSSAPHQLPLRLSRPLLLKHSIKAVRLASERRAIGACGLFAMIIEPCKRGCDLLLQHLEGLVDIVVSDETCTRRSSSNRAVDGPNGQAGRWRRDMHNSSADGTLGANQRRYLKSCLPMGTWNAK